MASVAEDLRDFLTASPQSVSNVVVGPLQDSPDLQVAVIQTSGGLPEVAMGPTLIKRHVSFQVMVRGTADGFEAARNLADTVHALLSPIKDATVNSVTYDYIVAVGEPAYIGRDDKDRPTWSANYDAIR